MILVLLFNWNATEKAEQPLEGFGLKKSEEDKEGNHMREEEKEGRPMGELIQWKMKDAH